MITNCPVCGKAYEVLWPNLWRYKRENVYLCSWGCMRALDDKKGLNRDMKLSEEQRKTAIDMALNGESPVKYIAGCGINNPSCTWWNLKKYLQKNDPETYGRLPEKFKATVKNVKQVETPEGEYAKAPVLKVDGAVRIETPEKNKVEVVETPEGKIGGLCPPPEEAIDTKFQTAAVRNKKLGTFYYDEAHGTIDWRHPYGEEISLFPEDYRLLRDSIDMILHVLGV